MTTSSTTAAGAAMASSHQAVDRLAVDQFSSTAGPSSSTSSSSSSTSSGTLTPTVTSTNAPQCLDEHASPAALPPYSALQEHPQSHQFPPISVPLIAELPADFTFPPKRSCSPSTNVGGTAGAAAAAAAAASDRLSTYSQVQVKVEDDGTALVDDYPTHPIKSMQGPFEESILDSIDPQPFDDRDTMDAVSRRRQLLELDSLSAEYSSRWRRRPGAKFHPLWKLIAQISFGIHLLHTQTAKSDEEVVRILQTHVDEVDGFLEDTSNDFALALKDIYERNRFLSVPLEHGRTFDKMLRDREFRTAIIEGNETIEHIVERTSQAMHYALQDIIQGIDATAELAKFLDRLVPQCVDNSEMIKIYAAMRGNAEGWWRCFCDLQVQSEKLTKLLNRLENILMEVNRRTGMASRRRLSKGSSHKSSDSHHISKQQRSSDSHRQSVSPAGSSPSDDQLLSRRHTQMPTSKRRHKSAQVPQLTTPSSNKLPHTSPSQQSLANKASQISFLEKPLPPDPMHAAKAAERIRTMDYSKPIPRASRTRSQPPTPKHRENRASIRESRSVENLAPLAIPETISTVPEEGEGIPPLALTAANLAPIDQQFNAHIRNPSDNKSRAPTIPDRSTRRPLLPKRSKTFEREPQASVYKYENADAIKSTPSLGKPGHKAGAPSSVYTEEVGLGIMRPRSTDNSTDEGLGFKYDGPDDIKSMFQGDGASTIEETADTSKKLEDLQDSIRKSSNIARLPSIPTLPSLESDDGSGSNTVDSAVDSAYASGGDSGVDDSGFGGKASKKSKLASYYDVPESIISLVADGRQSVDMTALPTIASDALEVDMGPEPKTPGGKNPRRPSLMAMKSLFQSKRAPRSKHLIGGGLGGNVAMV